MSIQDHVEVYDDAYDVKKEDPAVAGVVPDSRAYTELDEDPNTPVLRSGGFAVIRALRRCIYKIFPPGGILSSAFNLASGSLGAGILGLPAAANTAGLCMAMIYLVIITFFSIFSMHILAIVAQKTNIRSFEGIARHLFPGGKNAFSYWVAFIRWFHAFGGCVGYLISVGNCLSPIFAAAHKRQPDNKAIQYFNTTSGNRLLIALIWLCIMLPLVVPKHIDSLRYASMFAIVFMTYFVIIIIVHSCIHGLQEHRHNVVLSGNQFYDDPNEANIYLFRTGNPALGALGVFMFAYVCQINAYEVFWDMRPEIRTVGNYTIAALVGMMICGTLYVMVSIFGYFDFGSAALAKNSILLMYNPLEEPEVMLAYVGVLVKLCASYGILSIASRNSIYYVIGFQSKYAPRAHRYHDEDDHQETAETGAGEKERTSESREEEGLQKGSSPSCVTETDVQKPTAPRRQGREVVSTQLISGDDDSEVFIDNIPYWQHLIVVVVLAAVKLICGLFIPNINIVFGFAGAISGGFLAFIFPSLFYMYSGEFTVEKAGKFKFIVTYLLLLSGVTGVIFGTGATIFDTVIG